MNMNKQKGFTLIELVIVIIILGILAAVAIPKYMQLDQNARISTVNGLKGAIRSAAIMVRVTAKTNGIAGGVVVIDSTTGAQVNVNTSTYYPVANGAFGIAESLESYDGFDRTGTSPVVFQVSSAPTPASCSVSYSLAANGTPNIVATTTGC